MPIRLFNLIISMYWKGHFCSTFYTCKLFYIWFELTTRSWLCCWMIAEYMPYDIWWIYDVHRSSCGNDNDIIQYYRFAEYMIYDIWWLSICRIYDIWYMMIIYILGSSCLNCSQRLYFCLNFISNLASTFRSSDPLSSTQFKRWSISL